MDAYIHAFREKDGRALKWQFVSSYSAINWFGDGLGQRSLDNGRKYISKV